MSYDECIELLDETVVAGIAAGEVVDRPASIVKELVENALDAGARRVSVSYDDRDGGPAISVVDDGRGIRADQLERAIARHATSKIRSLADLERIESYGFRGEALASIAAVSRLELASRVAHAEEGARLVVEHGEVVLRGPAGIAPGTRVSVSNLFVRVPARRKFLKSASAEYAYAADVVRRFALGRADLHVRLVRNGRAVFDVARVESLAARLEQVFGRDVAAATVPVDARYGGLRLYGRVSGAGASWGSARRMALFVNGRWVQDRVLFRTVMDAYRTYLLKGRYPALVLFLEADPRVLDVNVHPQKLEVRFSDPQRVSAFVREAIVDALRGAASPLGRWGLGERDFDPRVLHGRRTEPRAVRPSAPARVAEAATAPAGYRATALSTAKESLPQQPALELPADTRPLGLRILGQAFLGYIVCERENELILIDQHAAHERVLFERLLRSKREGGRPASQALVVPQPVTLGCDRVEKLEEYAGVLVSCGWELDRFGEEEALVRAVPALLIEKDPVAVVERLADDLVRLGPGSAVERAIEEVMATTACHAAVRVGTRLEGSALNALLAEIASVDFGASCPHGRPVARMLERERLERLFGR